MAGKCKSARTCDAWTKGHFTEKVTAFLQKRSQSLLDVGIMSLIISKQDFVAVVNDSDFYGCGTNIDSKSVIQIHTSWEKPRTSFVGGNKVKLNRLPIHGNHYDVIRFP